MQVTLQVTCYLTYCVAFVAYYNNCIKLLDIAILPVEFEALHHHSDFFSVPLHISAILGLISCHYSQLDIIRHVDAISTSLVIPVQPSLLAEYSVVFSGLGCFSGELHVMLSIDAIPVINSPKCVSLVLQPNYKAALDGMEHDYITMNKHKLID